tara:strand:- start:2193 stop:2876 length:684 start_codon:yes stop_codon:yes gene_type:complete
MNKDKWKFEHLINNLERSSSKDSIFNYKSGRTAFLSLGQGNIDEWLDTLLPNTRLILEPKIIGSNIGLQYINGKLHKSINKNSEDITDKIKFIRTIPQNISVNERIEIRGVLYFDNISVKNNKHESIDITKASTEYNQIKYCVFQIFNCKINHFQALQELKKLDFEIPDTQFTNFISDIGIYLKCWKAGKLFQSYPTNGLVLKINSKKLQKYLGENNLTRNWAYAIN